MDYLNPLLVVLGTVASVLGIAYLSLRMRVARPRAADVIAESIRFFVALGIFTGCSVGPLLMLDLDSQAGMFAMITSVFWGPVLMIVGAVFAGLFLKLTRYEPRRTIGDIAREKADAEERRRLEGGSRR